MKKVISFVVAIALVLSMSVCAFAAPAADADYDTWVNYYTEVLNDTTLDSDAKAATIVANMPSSKAVFYAALDSAVADVMSEGAESEAFLVLVDDKLTAEKGWGLDEAEWEYEVEENLDVNIDGYIGNPADGNVAPNVPNEETPDLEEDTDDDSDSAGSFLDTILGVLGGLGDILFGDGGEETPDESTTDENDDPWGDEESTTGSNNDDSQVSDTGDTSVVAVATVALVAGAALVLTRKKSEDAE